MAQAVCEEALCRQYRECSQTQFTLQLRCILAPWLIKPLSDLVAHYAGNTVDDVFQLMQPTLARNDILFQQFPVAIEGADDTTHGAVQCTSCDVAECEFVDRRGQYHQDVTYTFPPQQQQKQYEQVTGASFFVLIVELERNDAFADLHPHGLDIHRLFDHVRLIVAGNTIEQLDSVRLPLVLKLYKLKCIQQTHEHTIQYHIPLPFSMMQGTRFLPLSYACYVSKRISVRFGSSVPVRRLQGRYIAATYFLPVHLRPPAKLQSIFRQSRCDIKRLNLPLSSSHFVHVDLPLNGGVPFLCLCLVDEMGAVIREVAVQSAHLFVGGSELAAAADDSLTIGGLDGFYLLPLVANMPASGIPTPMVDFSRVCSAKLKFTFTSSPTFRNQQVHLRVFWDVYNVAIFDAESFQCQFIDL